MKKILFIVHTDDSEKIRFLKNLCRSLTGFGADVFVFLMSRGVKALEDILDGGIDRRKVFLCSRSVLEFGGDKEVPEGVELSSQYKLSSMVTEADIIIPFI